jgi:hypothetical protein
MKLAKMGFQSIRLTVIETQFRIKHRIYCQVSLIILQGNIEQ